MSSAGPRGPILLLHKDVEFDDQVVYVTGNAYKACRFTRCCMVVKGLPFHMEECIFDSCVWHCDIVIHDDLQVKAMRDVLDMAGMSLPRAPGGADTT